MRTFLFALAMLGLAGCGSKEEVKSAVTAPVDNIQQDIKALDSAKSTIHDVVKNQKDALQQIEDSKKHGPAQ